MGEKNRGTVVATWRAPQLDDERLCLLFYSCRYVGMHSESPQKSFRLYLTAHTTTAFSCCRMGPWVSEASFPFESGWPKSQAAVDSADILAAMRLSMAAWIILTRSHISTPLTSKRKIGRAHV